MGACEIEDPFCIAAGHCTRPSQHVNFAEWTQAAVEARKRAAFESDRRVKDARKAYKAAIRVLPRRNPSPEQKAAERAAWEACSTVLAQVRSSLDQRERDGEFNP